MPRKTTGDRNVGKRVAAARRAKGLTQPELAKRLGIRQQSVSAIETGKTSMDSQTQKLLLRELEISADWLLGRRAMANEHEKLLDELLLALPKKAHADLKKLGPRELKQVARSLAALIEAGAATREPKTPRKKTKRTR